MGGIPGCAVGYLLVKVERGLAALEGGKLRLLDMPGCGGSVGGAWVWGWGGG